MRNSRLFGTIRFLWYALRFGLKPIKALWNFEIRKFNESGAIIPCPFCQKQYSHWIHRWCIGQEDQIGFFENNIFRLREAFSVGLSVDKDLVRRRLHLLLGRVHVDYFRCSVCGLVFQNFPHTASGKSFYFQNIYRFFSKQSSGPPVFFGRQDSDWIRHQKGIVDYFLSATQLPQGSQVLDAGCAEGWSCKFLYDAGMIPFGVEPSLPMVKFGQFFFHQAKFQCSHYWKGLFPSERFSGIISHHVIEHVIDFEEYLRSAFFHLQKGGFFLLQTPCLDGHLDEDYCRKRILWGGHIYCFSVKFLKKLMERIGFSILEIRTTPPRFTDLPQADRSPNGFPIWGDDPLSLSLLAKK